MKIMKKLSSLLFVFLAVLFFAGCASVNAKWQSRVGKYTYDDTIKELGPADQIANDSRGEKICSWIVREHRNWKDKLILVFDKDGKLISGREQRF
jgi:hypothetical protein